MTAVEHIPATTVHARRGPVANSFRYGIDYVLLDPEAEVDAPLGFSRNRRNLMSLRDRDHGGAPGEGHGAAWLRAALAERGLAQVTSGRVLLLAQPRVLGHVFNPVSFWLAHDPEGRLRVVVAEVTNTFGDRHSYLCHREDLAPISATDRLAARKLLHVSPFQPVAGGYVFRFDIRDDRIGIRIDFDAGGDGAGLVATLTGPRRVLGTGAILRASLRRPFGSRRVLGLIHWQALRLWWKGARYRPRPLPPTGGISR